MTHAVTNAINMNNAINKSSLITFTMTYLIYVIDMTNLTNPIEMTNPTNLTNLINPIDMTKPTTVIR